MEPKPLPFVPDAVSEPFWQGCREGHFLLQRCSGCATFRYPPRVVCPYCVGGQFTWQKASGKGTVYSWTVTHQGFSPKWRDRVPYVVVLVQLEEGPKIISNLVDCDPDTIRPGMPVEIVFRDALENITLPFFRPVQNDFGG